MKAIDLFCVAGGLSLGLVELKQAAEKLVGMPPAFLPEELEGSQ